MQRSSMKTIIHYTFFRTSFHNLQPVSSHLFEDRNVGDHVDLVLPPLVQVHDHLVPTLCSLLAVPHSALFTSRPTSY